MSYRDLLTQRCTIQRNTNTNSDGVLSPSWADLATNVPCLKQDQRGRINYGAAGGGLEYDAILFVLPSQDIKPAEGDDQNDRIVMTRPSGGTFLVQHVTDPSGQDETKEVYLRRLAT